MFCSKRCSNQQYRLKNKNIVKEIIYSGTCIICGEPKRASNKSACSKLCGAKVTAIINAGFDCNEIINNKKKCTKCGISKNITEFARNKLSPIGLSTICKKCDNAIMREYRKSEKYKAYRNKYQRNREKIDVKFALNRRISCAVKDSLKCKGEHGKRGRHWEDLVGFTLDELKAHLESQFVNGMGWHNRKKWHIDHIIPVNSYDYEKAEDDNFKKCWRLENLRPLWASENISKSDKLGLDIQIGLM